MRKRMLLALVTPLFAAAALAQSPSLTSVAVAPAPKHPSWSAEFDVRSATGEVVDTVTEVDVSVDEDGRTVKGTLTSGNPTGSAFVFVVDTSGSMAGLLDKIKPALLDLVGMLTPQDQAALVTFNDDAVVLQPLTADRAAIASALEQMKPGGKTTELYYAVNKASELLTSPGVASRKLMVVISDGKDEGTAYTLDDVIRKSAQVGANIVALGIAGRENQYLRNLQRMSELTEGAYVQIDPGQPWQEKIRLVTRYANARKHFAWQSTLAADGREHEVVLKVALGETVLTRPLRIALPPAPPPPPKEEPFDWTLWGGVAAGTILLIAVAVWLVVRSRRRRAAELRAMEERLEEERQAKGELKAEMERGIGDLREKLATLEQPMPPAASPAAAAKKKTVFISGAGAPVTPETYATAALHVMDGALRGSQLPLLALATTIGRDDDNNIVLDEQRVSLHHARVAREANGTWWLEDLGSTNGTYMEEQRVADRIALRSGATIRVGSVSMRFVGQA